VIEDLNEERVAAEIRGRWGRPVMVLSATGSTNDEALRWAQAGAPEGAIVVADHQTQGRGRRGRQWSSQPGQALLFSLVLRPAGPAARLQLLTTAVGVACARALESTTGLRIGLKWPNDLIVEGRKIGGILVETRVTGAEVEVAVIGIGINFLDLSEPPSELAARASSLAAALDAAGRGRPPARALVLASILSSLEQLYPALDAQTVLKEAQARSEVLGRTVVLEHSDGTRIEGRVVALLPSGALELRAGGSQVAVSSGEVTALRYS
jgi:BirA family transcriptional regulator, biotin operon repressor / biotin---[acetyl-CoA-carboxylase] ligase